MGVQRAAGKDGPAAMNDARTGGRGTGTDKLKRGINPNS